MAQGAKGVPHRHPTTSRCVSDRVAHRLSRILAPPWAVAAFSVILVSLEPGPHWRKGLWLATLLLFATVLPSVVVYVGMRKGRFTDVDVSARHQRPLPVFAGLVSLAIALKLVHLTGAPYPVQQAALAMVLSTAIVMVVTLFWKISVHTSAITLVTVILSTLWGGRWDLGLLLIPAMAWARVHLRAHTPGQVLAGVAASLLAVEVAFGAHP